VQQSSTGVANTWRCDYHDALLHVFLYIFIFHFFKKKIYPTENCMLLLCLLLWRVKEPSIKMGKSCLNTFINHLDFLGIALANILLHNAISFIFPSFSFFLNIINVGVRISLRALRLIPRSLKLTTMYASSNLKIRETRTGDL